MPYVGSYVWKIRQKTGTDLLLMPGVEVVAVRDGKFLLIHNKDFDEWLFPGGYAEDDSPQWRDTAVRELMEEGGVEVAPEGLRLFAIHSGLLMRYPNGGCSQAFGACFAVEDIISETDVLDEEEITAKRWFSAAEIEESGLVPPRVKSLFAAYKEWRETGEVQVVEYERDGGLRG